MVQLCIRGVLIIKDFFKSRILIVKSFMGKKIGCVIAYKKNHTNYGTSLVGYALVKKIQQLGYDTAIINYVRRYSFKEKLSIGWNQFRILGLKLFRSHLVKISNNPNYINGIKIRTQAVEAYKSKKLLPFFHDYVGYESLKKGSKEYEIVVVGSDQVWLPTGLKTGFFNLLFVDDDVRKVSYASSFGVNEIPKFQRKETARFLKRFYRISVREQNGKDIIDSLFKNEAKVVADPTMLLDRNEWDDEVKNSNINTSKPYIFCYFLGSNQEARKAANKLKEKTGYKIITIRHMDEFVEDDELFGDEAPYNVDPDDFVNYIKNAEYVLTDSFHCSAFSIQYQKKFMTFYRFAEGTKGGRNSRIDSLFNILGIPKEHIYQGDVMKVDSVIDWKSVNEKLCNFRNESIEYLKEALL